MGLNKGDLTDAQLAQLGIDRDTYLRNGIKYKAKATITVYPLDNNDDGSKYFSWQQGPKHDEDGAPHDSEQDVLNNFGQALDNGVGTIDFNVSWAPYLQGGTIYIPKVIV